jgi:hypothetical protein
VNELVTVSFIVGASENKLESMLFSSSPRGTEAKVANKKLIRVEKIIFVICFVVF